MKRGFDLSQNSRRHLLMVIIMLFLKYEQTYLWNCILIHPVLAFSTFLFNSACRHACLFNMKKDYVKGVVLDKNRTHLKAAAHLKLKKN